jgi:SNF2 family DNA or RNA helicase
MSDIGTLNIEALPGVVALFPDVKPVNGTLELEHTPRVTIPLRKMGFNVPSSIINYDWCGGSPFDIQKRTVEHLVENPRGYCLNSMGTGKTRCVLWAYDWLRRLGIAKKMIVVCPLSTMHFVWAAEILKATPHLRWTILHGTREQRMKKLADPSVDVYIINHDGLGIIRKELDQRKDIDLLVFDELAVYRNPSQRTKMACKIAEKFPIVWGLTGAPLPTEVTDFFNQCRVVTPWRVPKYFSHIRDELMIKVSNFKWVPKRGAVERAFNYMQPSVRYTLDDIMELPEFVSQTIETAMSDEQVRVYGDLRKHCAAMVANGQITAANAGVVMSKLLQVSSGWLYDSNKKAHDLGGSDRIRTIYERVEASPHKVIVFCNYLHTMHGLHKNLSQLGFTPHLVHGDTTLAERSRIFNAFQNTDDPSPLLAHPRCVSHGLTLTAADTVIWNGPPLSAETYDQANARIRRVGQRNKQLFLHLASTPVEKRVYQMLINRILTQDSFLELLEDASW